MELAKATPAMNLELVTDLHCRAGRTTYEAGGYLVPKFWAQGTQARAVATPVTMQGMDLDISRGVVMFVYLLDLTEGRFFGRTAEAWSKTHHDGDQVPANGLASIADTDPAVRTAIVSQGCDLRTGEAHTTMMAFDLDDDAQPIWSHISTPGPTGQFDVVTRAVTAFHASPRRRLSAHEIDVFVDHCGWRLLIIDD
jgi:hypothetical protein